MSKCTYSDCIESDKYLSDIARFKCSAYRLQIEEERINIFLEIKEHVILIS